MKRKRPTSSSSSDNDSDSSSDESALRLDLTPPMNHYQDDALTLTLSPQQLTDDCDDAETLSPIMAHHQHLSLPPTLESIDSNPSVVVAAENNDDDDDDDDNKQPKQKQQQQQMVMMMTADQTNRKRFQFLWVHVPEFRHSNDSISQLLYLEIKHDMKNCKIQLQLQADLDRCKLDSEFRFYYNYRIAAACGHFIVSNGRVYKLDDLKQIRQKQQASSAAAASSTLHPELDEIDYMSELKVYISRRGVEYSNMDRDRDNAVHEHEHVSRMNDTLGMMWQNRHAQQSIQSIMVSHHLRSVLKTKLVSSQLTALRTDSKYRDIHNRMVAIPNGMFVLSNGESVPTADLVNPSAYRAKYDDSTGDEFPFPSTEDAVLEFKTCNHQSAAAEEDFTDFME